MRKLTTLALLLAAALTIGCGEKKEEPAGNGNGDGMKMDTGATEVDKAIGELAEADQKLARAQKDCPVSGQPLGSMGTPIKLDVKGQTVFLCCEGCRKAIMAEPDKYLAKLKK